MDIRKIHLSDLDMLEMLEEACQPYPWSRENIAEELSRSQEESFSLLGVNSEGEGMSYVIAREVVGELWILQVGTDPDYRRQGYSKQILSQVLEMASNGGVKQAVLEVRVHNEGAIALYESLLFQQDGYRPKYYPSLIEGGPKEDAVLMSKLLV